MIQLYDDPLALKIRRQAQELNDLETERRNLEEYVKLCEERLLQLNPHETLPLSKQVVLKRRNQSPSQSMFNQQNTHFSKDTNSSLERKFDKIQKRLNEKEKEVERLQRDLSRKEKASMTQEKRLQMLELEIGRMRKDGMSSPTILLEKEAFIRKLESQVEALQKEKDRITQYTEVLEKSKLETTIVQENDNAILGELNRLRKSNIELLEKETSWREKALKFETKFLQHDDILLKVHRQLLETCEKASSGRLVTGKEFYQKTNEKDGDVHSLPESLSTLELTQICTKQLDSYVDRIQSMEQLSKRKDSAMRRLKTLLDESMSSREPSTTNRELSTIHHLVPQLESIFQSQLSKDEMNIDQILLDIGNLTEWKLPNLCLFLKKNVAVKNLPKTNDLEFENSLTMALKRSKDALKAAQEYTKERDAENVKLLTKIEYLETLLYESKAETPVHLPLHRERIEFADDGFHVVATESIKEAGDLVIKQTHRVEELSQKLSTLQGEYLKLKKMFTLTEDDQKQCMRAAISMLNRLFNENSSCKAVEELKTAMKSFPGNEFGISSSITAIQRICIVLSGVVEYYKETEQVADEYKL